MSPVEELEAEVARAEAELKKQVDRAHALSRELGGRLKALKDQVGAIPHKELAARINTLELPKWSDGPIAKAADAARREAVKGRQAAVFDLQHRLPDFTGALSRLQYKI